MKSTLTSERFRRLCALALGLATCVHGAIAGPLEKRGSYAGAFSWYFNGTVSGDDIMTVWGGAGTGSFRHEANKGFLHGALVVCTSAGVSRKDGSADDRGDCIVTDKDGDRVFAKWRCTQCPAVGEFLWLGGTGKYTGISGQNTYENNYAGPPGSPAGWSAWKGNWELRP